MDNNDPSLRKTIKSDLTEHTLYKSMGRDLKDLKEFYISPENKKRMANMHIFKRSIFSFFWLLKSMILKLTPARRIFLLAGIILLFISGDTIRINQNVTISFNIAIPAALLIIVVLMLELKDKLLARSELEAGRKVQEALMPQENPKLQNWEVWLYSKPANEVCGDLIDYIKYDNNSYSFYISDVAGKGLNAALLTTKLQSIIRTLADDLSLSDLITKVNNVFHKESLRKIFASLLYFEIKENSYEVNFVNAGHFPPVILKKNGYQKLEKGGTALGMMKDFKYCVQTVYLEAGDMFICYSDGVTEAQNKQREFYGEERLLNMLLSNSFLSPDKIGEKIIFTVEKFIASDKLTDDLSLIIIKRK